MSQRQKVVAIVILFAIALLCWGIRSSMMASAQKVADESVAQVESQQDACVRLEARLAQAKLAHFPKYLEGVSAADSWSALDEAEKLTKLARQAGHPNTVRRYANQAKAKVAQAGGALSDISVRLDFLDTALVKYKAEPNQVATMIADYQKGRGQLRQQGYFDQNFTDPERVIAAAQKRLDLTATLAKKTVAQGRPDYVAIYQACLDGERFAADAKQLAQAVPALRQTNEARIAKLPRVYGQARAAYEPAWVAAKNLETYPAYRCLAKVETTHNGMIGLDERLKQASESNSMAVQDFKTAARTLSEAETTLARAIMFFNQTSDAWQDVERAVKQCGSARSAAQDAIDRAEKYANDWSENDQTEAQDLISQALGEVRAGDLVRTSDPPKALAHFRNAENLAVEAYNAVDTHRHTTTTTTGGGGLGGILSDDDGDGGGLLGGGGGGILDSGGGGGGLGGGMDTGPIGGGADFGPTGGGVGGGDF